MAALAPTKPSGWTIAAIDDLAALFRDRQSNRANAARLGLTAGQVAAQIWRLRQAGDPRFATEARAPRSLRPGADTQRGRDAADADALAELIAEGATLAAAARRLQLGWDRAEDLWRRICAALGSQAR